MKKIKTFMLTSIAFVACAITSYTNAGNLDGIIDADWCSCKATINMTVREKINKLMEVQTLTNFCPDAERIEAEIASLVPKLFNAKTTCMVNTTHTERSVLIVDIPTNTEQPKMWKLSPTGIEEKKPLSIKKRK